MSWVGAVFFLVMKLVMTERTCHLLDDNTLSLVVTSEEDCEEYAWKTSDGTGVAHGQNYSTTLVLRKEHVSRQYNITFITCQPNVSFTCDKETTSCKNSCPAQISWQDKLSRKHFIASVLVVIFVLILLAVIITMWNKFKPNGCFPAEPDSPLDNSDEHTGLEVREVAVSISWTNRT